MVQPTSPHLPKTRSFLSFPPSSLARSFLSLSFRCRRLLPALHFGESLSHSIHQASSTFSRIKMGISPTAFSSAEAPPIPLLCCARPMFTSRALCMPPRCRHSSTTYLSRLPRHFIARSARGILVRIRRPCRATSYASKRATGFGGGAAWPSSGVLVAAAAAALDESGGLESAAEKEGKWGSGSGTEMPCQQATDGGGLASSHFSSLYHIIRKSASRPRRRT